MAVPVLPTRFDDTATQDWEFSVDRGPAIVQGDMFESVFQITDTNGDPFDLSLWTVEGQLRADVADSATTVLADYQIIVDDAVLGLCRRRLSPTQTTALTYQPMKYDVQITNVSDPKYEVGDVFTRFYGDAALWQEVTRGS